MFVPLLYAITSFSTEDDWYPPLDNGAFRNFSFQTGVITDLDGKRMWERLISEYRDQYRRIENVGILRALYTELTASRHPSGQRQEYFLLKDRYREYDLDDPANLYEKANQYANGIPQNVVSTHIRIDLPIPEPLILHNLGAPLAEPPPADEEDVDNQENDVPRTRRRLFNGFSENDSDAISESDAQMLSGAYNLFVQSYVDAHRGCEFNMLTALADYRSEEQTIRFLQDSEETPNMRTADAGERGRDATRLRDDVARLAARVPHNMGAEHVRLVRRYVGRAITWDYETIASSGSVASVDEFLGVVVGIIWVRAVVDVEPCFCFVTRFDYMRTEDGPDGRPREVRRCVALEITGHGEAAFRRQARRASVAPVAPTVLRPNVRRLRQLSFPDFAWDRDVSGPWERGARFARVFDQYSDWIPCFYGRVGSIGTQDARGRKVKVEFGSHYAELHGSAFREFGTGECTQVNLKLMSREEVRRKFGDDAAFDDQGVPTDAFMSIVWELNQLGAWASCGTADGTNRLSGTPRWWLTKKNGQTYEQVLGGRLGGAMWLHRAVLERMARRTTFEHRDDIDVTLANVLGRLRSVHRWASSVVPPRLMETVNELKAAKESVDPGTSTRYVERANEDEGGEEEELGAAQTAGFPQSMCIPWSRMKSPVGIKWKEIYAKTRFIAFSAGNLNAPPDVDEFSYEDGPDTFFSMNAWEPNRDAFYTVIKSGLLINAQLSSLYSTVGTRGHLRVAARRLCQGHAARCGPGGSDLHDYVHMGKHDARTMFFAPAELAPMPRYSPYRVVPSAEEGFQPMRGMSCDVFDFCDSQERVFGLKQYTQLPNAHMEFMVQECVRALRRSNGEKDDGLLRATMCSVELPVLNPFLLQSRSDNDKRCVMVQSQADFVFHVTDLHTESDRSVRASQQRGRLVMGEFKLLMETNTPRSSVCNTKNIRQVMTNAYMLESMLNVRLSYGVIFYLTRRGPLNDSRGADDVSRAYALAFPLHGENPYGEFTRHTDAVFERVMLDPLKSDGVALYTDRDHRIAFAKGAPRVVEDRARSTLLETNTRVAEEARCVVVNIQTRPWAGRRLPSPDEMGVVPHTVQRGTRVVDDEEARVGTIVEIFSDSDNEASSREGERGTWARVDFDIAAELHRIVFVEPAPAVAGSGRGRRGQRSRGRADESTPPPPPPPRPQPAPRRTRTTRRPRPVSRRGGTARGGRSRATHDDGPSEEVGGGDHMYPVRRLGGMHVFRAIGKQLYHREAAQQQRMRDAAVADDFYEDGAPGPALGTEQGLRRIQIKAAFREKVLLYAAAEQSAFEASDQVVEYDDSLEVPRSFRRRRSGGSTSPPPPPPPPPPPRENAFFGTEPPHTMGYRTEPRNPSDRGVRHQACGEAWGWAERVADALCDRSGQNGARANAVEGGTNELFRALFRMPEYALIRFSDGVDVDPIIPANFNVPMPIGNTYGRGNRDVLRHILVRSVHRLVNARAHGTFVVPGNVESTDAIARGSSLTHEQLAERIDHLGQRARWSRAAIAWLGNGAVHEACKDVGVALLAWLREQDPAPPPGAWNFADIERAMVAREEEEAA